jgi:hypothetical protein
MTATRKTSTSKDTTARPTGKFGTRDSKTGRVVLFPTEPSRLGKRKIEQAVDRVTSKK